MQTNIGIIILNYKTPNLVVDCLHSLEEQIEPGIEVVVVDNASNDGSAELIEKKIISKKWNAWTRVLCSPINGGFSAGNNFGIQSIDAKAYILLNSDTIILPGAIRELHLAMKTRPKAGLIAPMCVNQQGSHDRNTFHFIHPLSELIRSASTGPITRILHRFEVPFQVSDTIEEPDWIGFACVLIRREVIDQVGLLDDDFFMYFEDVDYCHRVKSAGWKTLYWPKAKIIHLLGGSSEFTSKSGIQARAPKYFYEARARYFAKHYGQIGLLFANLMWLLGHFISRARGLVGNKQAHHRKNEAQDIWINALTPFQVSSMSTKK